MSKVIQEQKPTLCWFKIFNQIMEEHPTLKNDVSFRADIELEKDKIREVIKKSNCEYKKMDEINEQLDENQREIKNNFGEIVEECNLFLKNFDEYEEGEN